jgi:hypothetical protein
MERDDKRFFLTEENKTQRPRMGVRGRGVRERTEGLDVEVEGKLPGVWAKADRIDLILPLVLDPGVDGVLGEDIAL